jgi:transketolase
VTEIPSLLDAFQMARLVKSKPSVIIAKTVMGKGVPRIEGDYRWHGKVPARDQAEEFLEEITK